MYYPSSENKGADQLRLTAKLICAFVFAYADCWFSHGAAQINASRVYMMYMLCDFLQEDHEHYKKKLEEMVSLQKKCLAGIAHQRYRMKKMNEAYK